MLLREAVTSVPDAVAARRVGIALAALATCVLVGGAYAAVQNRRAPIAQTPVITIAPATTPPVAIDRVFAADELPPAAIDRVLAADELALAVSELEAYRDLFYARSAGRCPARLLEINRFDARLHAVDPWGTPYQFLCGASYRPRFQVRSAGLDRVFDTEDDVRR